MMTNPIIHKIATALTERYNLTIDELSRVLAFDFKYQSSNLVITDDIFESFDYQIIEDKRNKTGSYYTPMPLAKSIVNLAFVDYFSNSLLSEAEARDIFIHEKFDLELKKRGVLLESLSNITIIDIACGTGVFLIAVLDKIIEVYKGFDQSIAWHHLVGRIHGSDLQLDAVLMYKLWMSYRVLDMGLSVTPIYAICQDAILGAYEHKYDLVVGNPPYVGEKGNKALFEPYKSDVYYEGKMDLFYFFIYKGMSVLKEDGLLSYITTNYFITADGASKLRQFFRSVSINRLINLDDCKLFKNAKGMHNMIFNISRYDLEKTHVQILSKDAFQYEDLYKVKYDIEQSHLFTENNNMVLYERVDYSHIINKISSKSIHRLSDLVNINQGIVSGADRVTNRIASKCKEAILGEGIFVLTSPLNSEYVKPFYKNSHIKPYFIEEKPPGEMLYIDDSVVLSSDDIEYNHLLPYRPILDERREVKTGRRKWYALQWSRNKTIFEQEKIVVPQRSKRNTFAYTETPFYASADVYYLTQGPLHYLLGILNSKIVYFWLYNRGKRKGQDLELYAKPLSTIPIPLLDHKCYEKLEKDVKLYLSSKKDGILESIDQQLYKFYDLTEAEIKIIENMYK